MPNHETRNRIIEIISDVGMNPDDFMIGWEANSDDTIVGYDPHNYSSRRHRNKKYTVQYRGNIVALFEIEKRHGKTFNMSLSWNNVRWKDIDDIRITIKVIKETGEHTEMAVMPIGYLEVYLRKKNSTDEGDEIIYTNYIEDGVEGRKVQYFTNRYERIKKYRDQAIAVRGADCEVCGFSFEERYGEFGKGFIEVHHIRPISEGEREVNPETDMVCLCSNCHSMIHHETGRVLSVEELKNMLIST